VQEPDHSRLVVIGGGPAGYTAALYAARAGLEPICIEGFEAGGQIAKSARVENFPGAPGITGADLSWRIREQAEEFGTRIVVDDVIDVDFSRRPFVVVAAGGLFTGDAVIVATGSKPRSLGLPGETDLVGRGVAYCAICDGAFYEGQDVVVVGGGNAALSEALQLARIAAKVTLVHRRWQFRAESIVEDAVRNEDRIDIVLPTVVDELITDETECLSAVSLRHLTTGDRSRLDVHGLFVAVGHEPASALFAPYLKTHSGHITTIPGGTATSVAGVFAAGDVVDSRYRQAITAAASGCMAALDAERWLSTSEAADAAAEGGLTSRPGSSDDFATDAPAADAASTPDHSDPDPAAVPAPRPVPSQETRC
jgi:thioredoxin reductase (NADPH)